MELLDDMQFLVRRVSITRIDAQIPFQEGGRGCFVLSVARRFLTFRRYAATADSGCPSNQPQ
jgi:hypothetical protein